MEVDHFDPTKKKNSHQRYSNLFLASRHCNGAKGSIWPTGQQRSAGLRFLNCCKEHDYGTHIFEEKGTGKLIGFTPAGRYHIRILDLNAPHLITERRERAEILKTLSTIPAIIQGRFPGFMQAYSMLKGVVDKMIPPVPHEMEIAANNLN